MKVSSSVSKCIILLVMILSFFMLTSSSNLSGPLPDNEVPTDSIKANRQKFIDQITLLIAGKEKMAVDSVFDNLQVLGGFPAENLVDAMKAWSIALGVSCGHCHNTADFASDEIKKKDIAREMVSLGTMINAKLGTIDGLRQRPVINCITCHRGTLVPAVRLLTKE